MVGDAVHAARLRKRMHIAVQQGDAHALREAMHALYDARVSPLDSVTTVASFAPVVEVAALARLVDSPLIDETRQNVEHLWRNFGMHRDDAERILRELDSIDANSTIHPTTFGTDLGCKIDPTRHFN
jgi:hypothetical protein